MDGRELSSKLNYLGMERGIRRLALDDKLDTPEKIAVMSTVEICDLIAKRYVVLYEDSEELGLIDKDIYATISDNVKVISR